MPGREVSSAGAGDACRSCGARVEVVVDLGEQPAAGAFPLPDEGDPLVAPLQAALCPSCGLVQLAGDGPDEQDAPDAPPPTSSTTMAAHVRDFVRWLDGARFPRILEMASHGGHLSPFFLEAGHRTTVLEASRERAARLRDAGADVLLGWPDANGPLTGQAAFDLIVDNYLLSHLRSPREALEVMIAALAPHGSLVLEFDHLLPTITGLQFDAIRHGHRSYLTLTWLDAALRRLGWSVRRVARLPVYGGSLRVEARADLAPPPTQVMEVLRDERAAGLDQLATFDRFRADVDALLETTRQLLGAAFERGRATPAYGAPARGVTFLNALGPARGWIPFTVDRSPAKHGRVIPGTRTAIRPVDALGELPGADVLVLTWDIVREVRESLPSIEASGGRFLVAIPALAVIGPDGARPLPPERALDGLAHSSPARVP